MLAKIARPLGEFFLSGALFFKLKSFNWNEARYMRRTYPGFSAIEGAFKKAYRFRNPFKICKNHLIRQGETCVDAYGETPLPLYAKIAEELSISKEDQFLELGCGRGRGVLFMHHLTGCSSIGVDWVPFFITTATTLVKRMIPSAPVHFLCEKMQTADFSKASIIYLYGTCLEEEEIEGLVRRFETLSLSTRIVTVSFPLSEYSSQFSTLKQFTGKFPWGEGEIYLNVSQQKKREF